MADRIDQLKIGSNSYDIALPTDSKDTMFYTTASATANAFTVTVPDLAALYDGAVVNVRFNATTAANCTLDVNGLGAKRIEYRVGTFCTTHIAKNMYITLVYNAGGNSSAGTWVMQGAYDSNSNTWRKIQLNGTDKLGTATNTNPLNIVPGNNMTITESGGAFTFNSSYTDTWRPYYLNGVDQEDINLQILDNSDDDGTSGYIPVYWETVSYSSAGVGITAAALVTSKSIEDALGYTPATNGATVTSSVAFCETPSGTAAKVATMPGFALHDGQFILLQVLNTNTATSGVTLNVNNTGAKTIYINGSPWYASNQLNSGEYIATYSSSLNTWNLSTASLGCHKTGSWSGLTYTAGTVGRYGAPELTFTIPTGTSSTTVAKGNHTHSQYYVNNGTEELWCNGLYIGDTSPAAWHFTNAGYLYSNFIDIAGDEGIVLKSDVIITGTDDYAGGDYADLVVQNGNVYANYFYAGSDIRLKENINDTTLDANKLLDNLHIVDFNYKDDKDKKPTIGLIAQELEEVLPEKYHDSFIQIKHNDENNYLNINETKLVYIALLALKDQKKKIEDLEARLTALENK